MATPAQLFLKKVILSIINFVKKNWFLLILLGLAIVLFCALLKENIEEPFDSAASIPPDATNSSLTE
jgi:type II secretory pathway component PulF